MHPPASLPRQLRLLGSTRGMESGPDSTLSLNTISRCARWSRHAELDIPADGASQGILFTKLSGTSISAAVRKRRLARGLARFPRQAREGRRPAAYSASRGKWHSCWWWCSPPTLGAGGSAVPPFSVLPAPL